jgi:hypothetical protein
MDAEFIGELLEGPESTRIVRCGQLSGTGEPRVRHRSTSRIPGAARLRRCAQQTGEIGLRQLYLQPEAENPFEPAGGAVDASPFVIMATISVTRMTLEISRSNDVPYVVRGRKLPMAASLAVTRGRRGHGRAGLVVDVGIAGGKVCGAKQPRSSTVGSTSVAVGPTPRARSRHPPRFRLAIRSSGRMTASDIRSLRLQERRNDPGVNKADIEVTEPPRRDGIERDRRRQLTSCVEGHVDRATYAALSVLTSRSPTVVK